MALPREPSIMAFGTLSGRFGRQVTYRAAPGPISSVDRPACRVATPFTYVSTSAADAGGGDDDETIVLVAIEAAAAPLPATTKSRLLHSYLSPAKPSDTDARDTRTRKRKKRREVVAIVVCGWKSRDA